KATRLAAADGLAVDAAVVDPRRPRLWALSDVPKGGSFLSCAGVRVVAIDPRTGRQSPRAIVRLPGDPCSAVSAPVLFGGYLYFLDQLAPPQRLYRVRL